MLDHFVDHGGTFIDTANAYCWWNNPGSHGGESEELIGRWFARTGRRDDVFLATKGSGLIDDLRRGVDADGRPDWIAGPAALRRRRRRQPPALGRRQPATGCRPTASTSTTCTSTTGRLRSRRRCRRLADVVRGRASIRHSAGPTSAPGDWARSVRSLRRTAWPVAGRQCSGSTACRTPVRAAAKAPSRSSVASRWTTSSARSGVEQERRARALVQVGHQRDRHRSGDTAVPGRPPRGEAMPVAADGRSRTRGSADRRARRRSALLPSAPTPCRRGG